MYASKNDLIDTVHIDVTKLLQARLFDAIDLSARLKQAHWNVKGMHFIELHELFDDIHGHIDGHVDLLAERITSLGGVAEGCIDVAAANSALSGYAVETGSGENYLKAIASALAEFGRSARNDIDAAAELGDAGTSDLFTGISREVDKQLWLVEAHLS